MRLDKEKELSVLVVEDDCVNFMLLEKLLRKSILPVGEIESAQSLDAALEITEDHDFDIIFLDLNLPDCNGLETITKTHKKCPDTAIIVVTGAYDDDLGPETIHFGAQEYLRKGKYDVDLLTQSIRYALERKLYERTLKNSEERYRKLFEEAMDAIIITNAETGTIIDCNKETTKLLRCDKSEIIGQHQKLFLPNTQSEDDLSTLLREHEGENEKWTVETQVATKDGQTREVAVKMNTFELEGKEVVQRIFRDVTELKRMEDPNHSICHNSISTQN
ncbi:MAG: PAS domain-containing response regulator [Planctomycetota bacterium]|jgi:PAS domain S-box-containing protein